MDMPNHTTMPTPQLGKASEEQARQELATFAKSLSGPYPDRYEKILTRAFLLYGLILPARPLREIAGGGTQGAAQQALEKWIRDLHSKVSYRIKTASEVPPSLALLFEEALPRMWDLAHQEASRQFDAEREAAKRRYAQLEDEFHLRGQELSATIELVGATRGELAACEERAKLLAQDVHRLNEALDQAQASLRAAAKHRAQIEADLACARSELETTKADCQAQLAEHAKECAHTIQLEMERCRREVSNLQAQADKTIAALQSEKRELQQSRDKAVKESTEAEIARARAERDAAEHRKQAADAQDAAKAAAQDKERVHDALRHQQDLMAAMKQELLQSQSKAIDASMLLQWVLNGQPAEIPEMHPSLAAIAQVLRSSKRGKRSQSIAD